MGFWRSSFDARDQLEPFADAFLSFHFNKKCRYFMHECYGMHPFMSRKVLDFELEEDFSTDIGVFLLI